MKSDIIKIDNAGNGFGEALEQTKKVAQYEGISEEDTIKLQVLTEEMLSLARSITGEIEASFWIELENMEATMHMTTHTILDKEKRAELIGSSSSRKNDAVHSFLSWLRDKVEEALAADPEHFNPSADLLNDLPAADSASEDWDGFERSILRRMADNVSVSIRGDVVDIAVSKHLDIQE